MMRPIIFQIVFAVLIFTAFGAAAQKNKALDQKRLLKMRDNFDNLLMVSPQSSAILVKRGEVELYSFNSLMSSARFNDRNGHKVFQPGKFTVFNSLLQINVGVSRSRRINLGFDVNYRAIRYDEVGDNSIFRIFKKDSVVTRAVNYAGLRARFQPFKRLYNFSYQTYLWHPLGTVRKQNALRSSKLIWGNTFFYYKYFDKKVGIFAQTGVDLFIPNGNTTNELENTTECAIPLILSMSYVVSQKNILYGSLSYMYVSSNIENVFKGANYDFAQFAMGYQRVISKRLFFNINYSGTIFSRNYGEWNSFNLVARYAY